MGEEAGQNGVNREWLNGSAAKVGNRSAGHGLLYVAPVIFFVLLFLFTGIAALMSHRAIVHAAKVGARAHAARQAQALASAISTQMPRRAPVISVQADTAQFREYEETLRPCAEAMGLRSLRIEASPGGHMTGPLSDFSARAPIVDASGRSRGYVECVADATAWVARQSHFARMALAVGAALAIALFGLWAVAMYRRRAAAERSGLLTRHTETLAVALAAAYAAWLILEVQSDHTRLRQEERIANLRLRALQSVGEQMDLTRLFLKALAQFFEGSDQVTPEEFERFALPLMETIGAVRLAWHPAVPESESEEFAEALRQVRSEWAAAAWLGLRLEHPDGDVSYPAFYEILDSTDAGAPLAEMGAPEELAAALVRSVSSGGVATAVTIPPSRLWCRGMAHVFHPVRRKTDIAGWRWSSEGVVSASIPLSYWCESAAFRTAAGASLFDVHIAPANGAPAEIRGEESMGSDDEPLVSPNAPALMALPGLSRLWLMDLRPRPELLLSISGGNSWPRHVLAALVVALLTSAAAFAREREFRLETIVERRGAELLGRERQLQESEERYRALFHSVADGFALHEVVRDAEGRVADYKFLEVNPAFERLTGLRAAELIGRTVRDPLPGIDLKWQEIYDRVSRSGEPVHIEFYAAPLRRYFEVRAFPAGAERFATVFQDVTDRKQMEEERAHMDRRLRQSERLESLGLLAGGIAHDFNNILMAILGNAELAGLHASQPAVVADHLSEIVTASRRAADLCRQMLVYAGKGRISVGAVDLNALVQEMAQLLKTAVSPKTQINLCLAPGLPPALADASQVRQVIMNLVINASEALDGREGTITISTGERYCDRAFLDGALFADEAEPGPFVCLRVADTGRGMDAETLSRIFDPFFTTKFAGRGLGLSTVMGIVRGHHGALTVSSQPGCGSVFEVYWSMARSAPSTGADTSESSPAESWKGSGRVLLADDEESVREIAAAMLEDLGFTCVAVPDGTDAIEALRQHPQDFTLAIVDLTMPHVDGEYAMCRLKEIRPDLPVYLASGYNAADLAVRLRSKGFAGFIQKPFTLNELRNLLRALSTASAGGSSSDGESKSTAPGAPEQNPQ